jgi:hypothetical protein
MNFKLTNNGQIPKHVEHFIETLPDEQKFSNVYEITVEDRNGKILDTKYGINTMTTRGFQREINVRYAYCDYIIIGKGTGTTTVNDTLMFEDIPGIYSIPNTHYDLSNTSGATNTYDPVSNCMIGRRLTGSFTMDYETNNDTVLEADGNPHITEFAEFELDGWNANDRPYDPEHYANNNIMHTHCLIYDENHQPSYFDKIRGTKVTVRIYRANKVSCDMIDDLWDQGTYLFINPVFMLNDSSMANNGARWKMPGCTGSVHCGRNRTEDDYPLYKCPKTGRIQFGDSSDFSNLLRWYNWGYGHSSDGYGHITMSTGGDGNWGTVALSPSGYRNNITFGEYIQTDTNYVKAGIIFLHYERSYQVDGYWGYRWYQRGQKSTANQVFVFKKINLDEPEEMELEWAYTDDFLHPQFRNIFGLSHYYYDWPYMLKQQLPCNDFHLTSVKRYNYLTDDYDINETFTDDPNYDFRNPERAAWGHMYLSGFKNNATFDVYLNINPDIAIEGFNDSSIYEIYMTDTYWDHASFVKLEDNHVVPAALQHKKYIIKYPSTSASNSDNGMAKTGIHPQRAVNNHKIVPADSTIELDIQLPLTGYAQWSYKRMYSSDDGWIYCHGKLIYPESDDGTGHPYVYTIPIITNGYSESMIKFTHNKIVIINDTLDIYPFETDRVRFSVYTIDPTNPDVDPTLTPTNYFDPDVKFELTKNDGNDFRNFAICVVDEPKNRLYIERKGHILLVNLEDTTHNIVEITDNNDPTKMHVNTDNNNGRWSVIYGTEYLVGWITNDATTYTFEIYDLENHEVHCTFTIPRVYQSSIQLHHMFGYKDAVYIQLLIDSVYHIFIYKYDDDELIDRSSCCWNYIYMRNGDAGTHGTRSANYKWNMMKYDDDAMIISCYADEANDYNLGARTMIIPAEDTAETFMFDSVEANGAYTGSRPNSFVSTGQYGIPDIKKFNNGQDYMALIRGVILPYDNTSNNSTTMAGSTYILNFGYIKNRRLTTPALLNEKYVAPFFKVPNAYRDMKGNSTVDSTNTKAYDIFVGNYQTWYSECCFYKNKVFVVTTFGKVLLLPIDTFLHYKITGTTRTIQAHNHPRKYNKHSHGIIVDMIENM